MSDDKDLIARMKEHIQVLEQELSRLMSPPSKLTTILRAVDSERVLTTDGVLLLPPKLDKAGNPTKKRIPMPPLGTLMLSNVGGALLESLDTPLAGAEATVKRIFDGDMMEIEGGLGGGAALVFKGRVAECVKPGDTVQMDRTGSVALRLVPKDRSRHSVETSTGVTWEDIGGQDAAKEALREAVEGPIKHSALFKAYGKKTLKGVLLSGPPGCGKTLIAKATANAIREAHGKEEAETAFIYVKGPEVLNMWVGNTEAHIRGLFTQAKEHKEEHGYPATIFIDEADAILGKRGSHHASILSSTIVPTFLAEMDGMSDSGAFVLLATNRQDTLDPAIVREGRIDRKVHVGRPGLKESAQILSIHIKRTKVADDPDELAGAAAAEMFSDEHQLYCVSLKNQGGVEKFCIRHLVSGAMLAGVVDMATSIAIKRDVETGKASGIVKGDVVQAVGQIVNANRTLNHDDDLMLFAEQRGTDITAVQRIAA